MCFLQNGKARNGNELDPHVHLSHILIFELQTHMSDAHLNVEKAPSINSEGTITYRIKRGH